MIRFDSYLSEGRDSPLYHSTDLIHAFQIIRQNTFRGNTKHTYDKLLKGKLVDNGKGYAADLKGVSMTRNIRFAKIWNPIVFEFDQRKLSQRHKIIPTDYYYKNKDVSIASIGKPKSESEEFLIGDIKNASSYITCLHIERKFYKNVLKDEDYAQHMKFFVDRINKLKIEIKLYD